MSNHSIFTYCMSNNTSYATTLKNSLTPTKIITSIEPKSKAIKKDKGNYGVSYKSHTVSGLNGEKKLVVFSRNKVLKIENEKDKS